MGTMGEGGRDREREMLRKIEYKIKKTVLPETIFFSSLNAKIVESVVFAAVFISALSLHSHPLEFVLYVIAQFSNNTVFAKISKNFFFLFYNGSI